MRKNLIQIILLILQLFTINGICQSLYNGVGHIPESYRIDWSNAGLYNPDIQADHFINISDYTGTDDQNIVNALNDAGCGITIIYYPDGIYTFYNTINLKSNIVIQGESQETKFTFIIDKCNDCFTIFGSSLSNEVEITLNISKADNIINVSNTIGYDNYPWIQYVEKTNPNSFYGTKYVELGQISKITNYNSSTSMTVKDEASKDYITNYNLYLRKVTLIENVGIENIAIYRHQLDGGMGHGKTISFNLAVNCWVRGVDTWEVTITNINP